jgi:hypothetical protein
MPMRWLGHGCVEAALASAFEYISNISMVEGGQI